MELSEELYNQILELSEEGDSFVDEGDIASAIDKYQSALDLLPGSKYNWEASTWLYAALGDAYYLSGQDDDALECFMESLKCPDGLENPFINLRIGECFFNNNDSNNAREYLIRAYMSGGEEVFEDEPIKYFNEIKDLI